MFQAHQNVLHILKQIFLASAFIIALKKYFYGTSSIYKKPNIFKIEETFYCLLKCYLCSLKLFGKFDLILAGLKKNFWLVKHLKEKKKKKSDQL